jgi:hypothetical protein
LEAAFDTAARTASTKLTAMAMNPAEASMLKVCPSRAKLNLACGCGYLRLAWRIAVQPG